MCGIIMRGEYQERRTGGLIQEITVDEWQAKSWVRFGLGRVYQKMGKMRFAEYHFQRALEINPSNVVLYCCVGTVSMRREQGKVQTDAAVLAA